MRQLARRLAPIAALATILLVAAPASADLTRPPSGGGGGGGGTTAPASSPQRQEQIQDCTVYASGTSMGSYCSTSGGTSKTLRERFGGQEFVPCKHDDPPAWIQVPKNPNPDEGTYLLKSCIEDINWDTYGGGNAMHLAISLEWVPHGGRITPPDNDLMRFLWQRVQGNGTALPVPVMRPEPSQIPVVGYPTFFTFMWVDPATKNPVDEGPYAGQPLGGPYREVTVPGRGLRMKAEATEIVIDPHQTDMEPITCTPDDLGYQQGAPVAQQTSDCRITFTRSSATAQTFADADAPALPRVFVSSYPVTVTVRWRVTYGFDGQDMRQLGDGFEMTVTQALPVQEVQAPNEPPIAIY